MQIDFLIIGQGLAGSLLAWELNKRDCKVMVVDSGETNASLISAGIVNPITGMRFVKTARLEVVLPAAQQYYAELSDYFNQPFYIEKPMWRIVKNQTELTTCQKRLGQAGYLPFLGKLYPDQKKMAGFNAAYGFIEQKQTGHLLTVNLLSHIKQWLFAKDKLRLTPMIYNDISISSPVRWQDMTAKQIVFCEGHHSSKNPWFSWLPLKPAKGEILTLNALKPLPNKIFNYGQWLLPEKANKARIGATFEWDFLDPCPSQLGKEHLLRQLAAVTSQFSHADIIEHQAGIRPCTADKLPFIGRHPHYPQMAIFNGFGSKGCLLIPWYCQRFADYLLHSTPLPFSCDIQRYQSTCFPDQTGTYFN